MTTQVQKSIALNLSFVSQEQEAEAALRAGIKIGYEVMDIKVNVAWSDES